MLSGNEASFEKTVSIMQQAIDYGRKQERISALKRLQKTYDAGGFEGGDLPSWGSWEVARDVINGAIVHGEAD